MKKINTFVLSIWYEQNTKFSFRKYCKHAIVIMTAVAGLNTATAQGYINLQEEYYPIVVKAPKIEMPEEVTINGFVKDETGAPLANAKVRAEYGEELLTDNSGAFSFTLKKEKVASQNIFVSAEGVVTAVRSYHPSMVNTTYDITLYKPSICCNKIKLCEGVPFTTFTVNFKNNSSDLSEATKKQLDAIANSLKECPTGNIRLTLHIGENKSLQRSANNQLNAIKNYLIEQNGIAAERIKTNEVIDKINTNSVDVIAE
ncbi:carboxypeptidase-like regulatory domain-containing protein [Ferruginibacter lapsinanis]|uniref:carboxypeptidase regulatory-like domain-containing protein n=1 Tax=Ferruginibacter lapsinanis TaxID=563172 RepID=UPI001E3AD728|nr:carboxypeptidase regulatory-like domain-containing protein [Ferruginibacter lapsinanis]UEG49653.1 carboxypeptidase-like regulatory domain-containing protein [Ferruginibacter lapsinanis]